MSMAEVLEMSEEEFRRAVTFKKIENAKGVGNATNSVDTSELKSYWEENSAISITEATKILRHAFLTDNDLYNGLVASIESALRESTIVWEEWEYTETAKKIADRIVGIEK